LHANESDEQADAHRDRVAMGLRHTMKNLLLDPDEAEDGENKPGGGDGAQRLLLLAYPPRSRSAANGEGEEKIVAHGDRVVGHDAHQGRGNRAA
jgi:hypothetical protein